MTLPASGAISLGQVASELGVGLPLSLGATNVRRLAGVPSGSISLTNLYGKTRAVYSLVAATIELSGFPVGTGYWEGVAGSLTPGALRGVNIPYLYHDGSQLVVWVDATVANNFFNLVSYSGTDFLTSNTAVQNSNGRSYWAWSTGVGIAPGTTYSVEFLY